MIFDTSVWIDFSRGKKTPLAGLLQHRIYNDYKVYICPPVYQEILQGVKNKSELEEIKESSAILGFSFSRLLFCCRRRCQYISSIAKDRHHDPKTKQLYHCLLCDPLQSKTSAQRF